MRKIVNCIMRNWCLVLIGCVLTKEAVRFSYMDRGYIAVGGEWFIIPFILSVSELCHSIFREITEFIKGDGGDMEW